MNDGNVAATAIVAAFLFAGALIVTWPSWWTRLRLRLAPDPSVREESALQRYLGLMEEALELIQADPLRRATADKLPGTLSMMMLYDPDAMASERNRRTLLNEKLNYLARILTEHGWYASPVEEHVEWERHLIYLIDRTKYGDN